MIIRALDSSHDWTFGQGYSNYLSGNPAIGENIQTRILSWLGDCFFDTQAGIDWLNRLGSKNQRALLEADLRRIILQSFGVTALKSFSTSVVGRTFTANYTVDTIFSADYVSKITKEI